MRCTARCHMWALTCVASSHHLLARLVVRQSLVALRLKLQALTRGEGPGAFDSGSAQVRPICTALRAEPTSPKRLLPQQQQNHIHPCPYHPSMHMHLPLHCPVGNSDSQWPTMAHLVRRLAHVSACLVDVGSALACKGQQGAGRLWKKWQHGQDRRCPCRAACTEGHTCVEQADEQRVPVAGELLSCSAVSYSCTLPQRKLSALPGPWVPAALL